LSDVQRAQGQLIDGNVDPNKVDFDFAPLAIKKLIKKLIEKRL